MHNRVSKVLSVINIYDAAFDIQYTHLIHNSGPQGSNANKALKSHILENTNAKTTGFLLHLSLNHFITCIGFIVDVSFLLT